MSKYLNNKKLYKQVIISKALGKPTKELEDMLILLCKRVNNKFTYYNVMDKEDCLQESMFILFRNWRLFDEEKTENPFAFYTEIIKRAHTQGLNKLRGIKFSKGSGNRIHTVSLSGTNQENGGIFNL